MEKKMRTKHYPGAKIKTEPMRRGNADDFAEIGIDTIEIAMLPEGLSESDKWKLGGCPRCHGDVFLDTEDGELLGHCLQCGYVGARIIPRMPKSNAGSEVV